MSFSKHHSDCVAVSAAELYKCLHGIGVRQTL